MIKAILLAVMMSIAGFGVAFGGRASCTAYRFRPGADITKLQLSWIINNAGPAAGSTWEFYNGEKEASRLYVFKHTDSMPPGIARYFSCD